MTVRDEIKKQAEDIWSQMTSSNPDEIIKEIKQALLQRHNKSVEMAAEKVSAMDHCDIDKHECTKGMAEEIRALKI